MNFNQFIYKNLNYLFMIPNTSSCKFDTVKLVMHVTLNKVKYHSSQKKKKKKKKVKYHVYSKFKLTNHKVRLAQ